MRQRSHWITWASVWVVVVMLVMAVAPVASADTYVVTGSFNGGTVVMNQGDRLIISMGGADNVFWRVSAYDTRTLRLLSSTINGTITTFVFLATEDGFGQVRLMSETHGHLRPQDFLLNVMVNEQ